jgi:hypothetical protein
LWDFDLKKSMYSLISACLVVIVILVLSNLFVF